MGLDSRSKACGKDGEGAWTWIPDLKTHSSAGTVNVTFPVSYDRLTIADYLTILDNPLTDLTIASLLLHNCFTAMESPLHKLKMAYLAASPAEYFCQQGR